MAEFVETPDPLAPAPVATAPDEVAQLPTEIPMSEDECKRWNQRIEAWERRRVDLVRDAKENVNYRVCKPFSGDDGSTDRIALVEDWARTRQKVASLLFQLPEASLEPRHEMYKDATITYSAVLNDKAQNEMDLQFELDEALQDTVNAAGIGAVLVSYTAYTRPAMVDGQMVQQPISKCYEANRLPLGMLLLPREWKKSNWDKAPWVGCDTWLPLEKVRKLGWVNAEFKAQEEMPKDLLMSADIEDKNGTTGAAGDYVRVKQIWYRACHYSADAYHPDHIRRIVFVHGQEKPVVHEDFKWQQFIEPTAGTPAGPDQIDPLTQQPIPGSGAPAIMPTPGYYIGMRKFPIRILTLGYVSDVAIPPSDSRVARSSVREGMRSRQQMLQQRDHNIPMRWANVNLLDQTTADNLRNGKWQSIHFINGIGDRAIGEVARAQFPRENFEFMRVFENDQDRAWALKSPGALQQDDPSATEIKDVRATADEVLEYQRARVLRWVASIYEALGGLLQMFATDVDFIGVKGPDGVTRMQAWDRTKLPHQVIYKLRPDSSVRVDVNTKISNLLKLYNLAGKDPMLRRQYLLELIIILSGEDSSRLVQPPPPEKKEVPNISYRFSGDDTVNPIVIATMLQAGVEITPEILKGAHQLIVDAGLQPTLVPSDQRVEAVPASAGGTTTALPSPQPEHPGETPEQMTPIAKRANDGSRMT